MKPKVLVLEDNPTLLRTIASQLTRRGISVLTAQNVAEARQLMHREGDIDVAVLDIFMGVGAKGTGLDFGLELKDDRKEWPPEFLIYSIYDNTEYYQQALVLGAAAYLQKARIGGDSPNHPPQVEVLAQHIRALTLRRVLHAEVMAKQLRVLVEGSKSGEEAVERFCREIFARQLESTLGSNYILLLSHPEKPRNPPICISGVDLVPLSSTWLERVQRAAHTIGNVEPLVVNALDPYWLQDLSADEIEETRSGLAAIDGAAFIPLSEAKAFRLSLGLVPTDNPDTTKEQVKLLDRYLQRPVIRHLFDIAEIWSELDQKRRLERQEREILLEATRDFCLYQGQELSTLVADTAKELANLDVSDSLRKLQVVGDEMRDAGELLNLLAPSEERTMKVSELDMQELVGHVWRRDVYPRLAVANREFLQIRGTCRASDSQKRTERTVSQILGWLARRLTRRPLTDDTSVLVDCQTIGDAAHVVFEESISHRLPADIRKSFFAPFYARGGAEQLDDVPDKGRRLGLYLARALAEFAGGELLDRSDDMEGPRGHRFLLKLPAAKSA
jgi:CheY-like chemotaxis protein